MMEWITDKTGHFKLRPKYSHEDLEEICEAKMSTFLLSRHGDRDRIPTEDDLTTFLEALGVDLDLFANFESEEGWVQGVIDFSPTPPLVRIRQSLSEDRRYVNRYKFTLAHETSHAFL